MEDQFRNEISQKEFSYNWELQFKKVKNAKNIDYLAQRAKDEQDKNNQE